MGIPDKKTALYMLIFLLLMIIPTLYGGAAAGDDFVFSGFLFNPIDGSSYIAKMYQGWSGSWQFVLTYSSESGEGSYIFLFYLLLGHIARWLNIALVAVFHTARLLCGAFLLLTLRHFFTRVFSEERPAWRAFVLASAGSGMGWVAALTGVFTADFWLAEAYPFLAVYANPHFPLGIGLMLWGILLSFESTGWKTIVLSVFLGLALALVLPFCLVALGAVLLTAIVVGRGRGGGARFGQLASIAGGGLPVLVYQFYITKTNPLIAAWNAQNITLSPAVWDVILSLSPAVLIALWGIVQVLRRRHSKYAAVLVVWLVVALLLMYFPYQLQRRFATGIFIPISGLAVVGLQRLNGGGGRRWLWPVLLSLSLVTNILVVASGFFGVRTHDPDIYITREENMALDWVSDHAPHDAVVLCDPHFGRFVPAFTGRRVVYGHPFETLGAAQKEELVRRFYAGDLDDAEAGQFLQLHSVRYIMVGRRESRIGEPHFLNGLPVVYKNDGVSIYARE